MERGVRQGDSLSPFLFILVAEGLNVLIKEAVARDIFKGWPIGNDDVMVSLLQYVDDIVIFREWNRVNAKNLMCILKCFEEVVGLKINLNKSKLYDVGVERVEVEGMAWFVGCGTTHGRMILASIEKGPLVWPSITVDGVTRLKEYTELTPAEAIQADCDIKA
ncbi:putative RNA-directed DNA polymerase, eukaryota, reverse transcriptase zinc-binding domain protein, partial [Tanacetum coccineum]